MQLSLYDLETLHFWSLPQYEWIFLTNMREGFLELAERSSKQNMRLSLYDLKHYFWFKPQCQVQSSY